MSYKAVIEARANAEKNIESVREAVKIGLQMRKELEEIKKNTSNDWYM